MSAAEPLGIIEVFNRFFARAKLSNLISPRRHTLDCGGKRFRPYALVMCVLLLWHTLSQMGRRRRLRDGDEDDGTSECCVDAIRPYFGY